MAISQGVSQPSITKIRLKITYLKFLSHLPAANELTPHGHACMHVYLSNIAWTNADPLSTQPLEEASVNIESRYSFRKSDR